MKLTLFRLFLLCGIVAVIGQLMHSVKAEMFEDQLKVCNFENVCTTIAIDDYLTKHKASQLQSKFTNEQDTFNEHSQNRQDYHEDMLIELDNICRDSYHSFCFGDSWTSLTESLN